MASSSFVSDFLAPLGLLVAGAVISGLLVPYITRGWQRHQKKLELKVVLLRDLSETVTRVITHASWRDLGAKRELTEQDRAEFDWRYGEWEVRTQLIQAQLQAYFPDSPGIERHWANYCELLRALHKLSWLQQGRRELLNDLKAIYESDGLWHVEARASRMGPWRRKRSFSEKRPGEIMWSAFENTDCHRSYMDGPFKALKVGMESPRRPLTKAILFSGMKSF